MENALEAMLFASGEPVSIDRMCDALDLAQNDVTRLLGALSDRYAHSGLILVQLGSNWQLATRQAYGAYVKRAMETKRNTPLSQAALETLAVIAYNQPVSRSFVEQVRGVESSGVVNTLVQRGLVEEAGRLDLPGKPIAYKTTSNFLRCFSLASLDQLPPLPKEEEDAVVSPDGLDSHAPEDAPLVLQSP